MKRPRAIRNNSRPQWYQIKAKADDGTAEVLIYGDIGDSWWGDSVPASQFVRDLAEIDDSTPIDFYVHSPGGDVFDGLAIATAVRTHPAKTTVYVDGLAASAASFIAIAADETVMALGAQMMIHDAWGFAMGNAEDMTKMADDLNKVSGNIASLYAEKAGGDVAEWRSAMLAETWYSADEAVTAGLADRVDRKRKSEAKSAFDLSVFAHQGREDAPPPFFPGRARAQSRPAEPAEPITPQPEGSEMSDTLTSGLRERLGIRADAELDDEGLLAAVDEALAEQPESTPSLPEGTVAISQSVLAELQAKAARGDEARAQQFTDHREGLIRAALADGRIKPTDVDDWRASLTAQDGSVNATAAKILGGLAKNKAVPVEPLGYTGGVDEASDDDDRLYAELFGTDGKVA